MPRWQFLLLLSLPLYQLRPLLTAVAAAVAPAVLAVVAVVFPTMVAAVVPAVAASLVAAVAASAGAALVTAVFAAVVPSVMADVVAAAVPCCGCRVASEGALGTAIVSERRYCFKPLANANTQLNMYNCLNQHRKPFSAFTGILNLSLALLKIDFLRNGKFSVQYEGYWSSNELLHKPTRLLAETAMRTF
ncbi:hypothetical protein NDU88_004678 [Pleurodeles waltl]|uniref:Uncharacterized protein n=1 Tax=Pleurodeles waltl TaxID=8319 RepID=A0AAV7W5N1_PLEWA|nr:hypothetical protein NDU88_004678 [Pleurodeles waltl]